MKLGKGKFTWKNKRISPGHIAARLDKFLVQSSFLLMGLNGSSKILPSRVSDHKPIWMELKEATNLGSIPFRFIPLWIHKEGFLKIAQEVWMQHVNDSPFYVWEENLRRVKKALKD